MRVQKISFQGKNTTSQTSKLEQGRAEFSKLPLSKRAALEGIERFAREHAFEYPTLYSSQTQTPLGKYVRYKVSIAEAIKNTLTKFRYKV